MGYSVRVYGWRYTAWVYFNTSHFVADWNATASRVPPDSGLLDLAADRSYGATDLTGSSALASSFHPLAVELYDHRKQDAASP